MELKQANYTVATARCVKSDTFWWGWTNELLTALDDLRRGGDDGLDTAVLNDFYTRALNITLTARAVGWFTASVDKQIDEYMEAVQRTPLTEREFLDAAFTDFWRLYYRA